MRDGIFVVPAFSLCISRIGLAPHKHGLSITYRSHESRTPPCLHLEHWQLCYYDSMDHEEFKKIPNRLKKYRKIRGLSQRRVAAILGKKSPSRISQWENGKSIPNLPDVIRLSILYQTLIDGLFIGHVRAFREEMQPKEEKMR